MNLAEIVNFVGDNISYKEGWKFVVSTKDEVMFLQIQFEAPDNFDHTKIETQYCRKWQLSEWMTPTEIVETCWAAVQRAEIHEAAETFKYKNRDIYNRHISVDRLHELRSTKGSLEHRTSKK